MAASRARTRPKKLNTKQTVPIFREDQVEQVLELDASRGLIESGVEKSEENASDFDGLTDTISRLFSLTSHQEYHLQQAIKAAAGVKAKDAYIPTPPTIASNVQYGVLYPQRFQQPATYIRSSSTVEDCAGTPYCMDEEDEVVFKQINATLPRGVPECSEDLFEEVMNFFEETAQNKQPFAAVDNPPVLPLDELEEQFDETISPEIRTYAKFIYEHWHARRSAMDNRGLSPRLKFETGQDTDDADPYVCFRRRELRQIRKTRNRDAQSAEKLRKMRKELEDARQLLAMVKQREMIRKEVLNIDRTLFQQRAEVKETKRKLGIKGDDEDLVNQKPKKRIAELSPGQQALQQQLRLPLSRGGPGEDLRLLEDVQAEKQKAIEREIEQNVQKHIRWNEGFVDKTRAPLTPISPKSFASNSDFRQAMPATEYLPTPPASVSEDSPPHDTIADVDTSNNIVPTPFRYASPSEDDLNSNMPSFRRRIGRGGRVMFDRRIPFRPKEAPSNPIADRWSFDSDDEDAEREIAVSDDQDTFKMMLHRAYLFAKARDPEMAQAQAVRRAQIEASGHPNAAATSHQQSSSHQQTTS